jgi:hypothetical protein
VVVVVNVVELAELVEVKKVQLDPIAKYEVE